METEIDRLTRKWDLVLPAPRGLAWVTRPTAPRLTTLANARGAFLDNSKDNAATLLQSIARLLQTNFRAAGPTFYSKPLHTRIAPEFQVADASRLDFAVVAIGD
jgi:hypothetical protein